MINLEIDGQAVQVENGATVMDAATKAGVFVPHFCYHKKLSIAANCRMCLVQVEKAPKPLPACATPATEGMKVQTKSDYAVNAQKGVMEFLLVNHPLDCPICDQGGECQLQDLAVGYGGTESRYKEEKRVVFNKNLGPLISTDMTRCIHCTRCVRFGQEVAGVMELGMAGRGEHSEILTFVGNTVDSELSGNMIDLCPVGALTSKPFRYSARTWELSRRKSISAHDGLGSNLAVQVKQDKVMRVLPLETESINECWISDRDRFSYEALGSEQRMTKPMIREGGVLKETDWQTALTAAVAGLKNAGNSVALQTTSQQTLEELHLAKKLVNGVGSERINFTPQQRDSRLGSLRIGAAWLGMKLAELSKLKSVVVIGSTLRKEHPLITNRLRQAAKRGLAVNIVHVTDDDLLMKVANKAIATPSALVATLATVVVQAAEIKGLKASALAISNATSVVTAKAIAQSLVDAIAKPAPAAVLLGNYANQHADAAVINALANELATLTGATVGHMSEGANTVGGFALGYGQSKPQTNMPAAVIQLGAELLDQLNVVESAARLAQVPFVLALSAFQDEAHQHAHLVLPITPFTETAGSFVNMEGVAQSFHGVVKPLGEARPAWKVLRVLGAQLGLAGFELDSAEEVRRDIATDLNIFIAGKLNNGLHANVSSSLVAVAHQSNSEHLQRITEVPIYAGDAIVRRAPSLQKTADAKVVNTVRANAATLAALNAVAGQGARVGAAAQLVESKFTLDNAVPNGCVRIASCTSVFAALGDATDVKVIALASSLEHAA